MVRVRLIGPPDEVLAVAEMLRAAQPEVSGQSGPHNGKVTVYLKARPPKAPAGDGDPS